MGIFYRDGEQMEPWQKVGEEVVFEGMFVKIREKRFLKPDGVEEVFQVKGDVQGVKCVAVTKEGEFLLVEEFRVGLEVVKKELPGGIIDEDLTPEETVVKELEEETGYRAGKVVFLGQTNADPYSTMIRYHFLLLDCEETGRMGPEKDEFLKLVKMSREEFENHIYYGDISGRETGLLGLLWLDGRLKVDGVA
ncbi:hypothetical protein CVV38_01825 [Candidatus Peregrinibacteria bacterium HGW-Peregrinibacteria-1]|jgi:ADP-ribose pyrophosphatase|nr:MAG: hypothetical protein CVV38_01825 [Candidatus Peregrinibacteria bacterium HGW-Peregrinibacteria-1]